MCASRGVYVYVYVHAIAKEHVHTIVYVYGFASVYGCASVYVCVNVHDNVYAYGYGIRVVLSCFRMFVDVWVWLCECIWYVPL